MEFPPEGMFRILRKSGRRIASIHSVYRISAWGESLKPGTEVAYDGRKESLSHWRNFVRLSVLFLILTLILVLGLEQVYRPQTYDGDWPPEPQYGVIVTNNGPLYYVE
jgi:hypothetical protein